MGISGIFSVTALFSDRINKSASVSPSFYCCLRYNITIENVVNIISHIIIQFYKKRRDGLLCGKSDFSDGGRACCVLLRGVRGALPAVGIDAFFVIS